MPLTLGPPPRDVNDPKLPQWLSRLWEYLKGANTVVSGIYFTATQRVFGRNSAGAGAGEEVTATQVLDWIGSTRGQVLYRGSSAWSALSPGTSQFALLSNGAGADPSYTQITDRVGTDTTQTGNVGVGEDDLDSVTLGASALASDGMYIKVRAWGTFANNSNTKTLKLYFGATAIITVTLATGLSGSWVLDAEVVRTGATTQKAITTSIYNSSGLGSVHHMELASPAETLSSSVVVKCTGEGTDDNDIVQEGITVMLIA